MRLALKAVSGPAAGREVSVRRGYMIKVGNTDWADVNLSEDAELADVHFQLDFVSGVCTLRHLAAGASTLVNGEEVTEIELNNGDEVIAGQTSFVVALDGVQAEAESASAAEAAGPSGPQAADFCGQLKLSKRAAPILKTNPSPEEFLDVLVERQLILDAVKFLAHWLPKRAAIEWALESLRALGDAALTDDDPEILAAVDAWLAEGSDENRRAAGALGEAAKPKTAAAWIALAAYWSEGSIAPADLEEVPPAEHLTAAAIAGAMTKIVSQSPPEQRMQFIDRGREIQANTPPSESAA